MTKLPRRRLSPSPTCCQIRPIPVYTTILTLFTLTPSPYVEPLLWDFTAQGYVAVIHTVSYELQRGGNQMLSIKKHPNQ